VSVRSPSAIGWPVSPRTPSAVIWHDIECGRYTADLPLWRRLAAEHPGGVLEIGAGTGRVALDLASRGHRVVALDRDRVLLNELTRRARLLARGRSQPVEVVTTQADAQAFELDREFALIAVPMQTIQLLGGAAGRAAFLARAARHLQPGGRLAVALTEHFDLYDSDGAGRDRLPLPDVREVSGTVYRSQPTAVRREGEKVALERRRERLRPDRSRRVQSDRLTLDLISPARLEREARQVGLRPAGRVNIAPTPDHVGSVVVMFDA
jgi:SAM-dependent methyltransferase